MCSSDLTRRAGAFVVVDCAALTESLVESTLFGHRKGAFTSALTDRDGLVKLADGGTLFLDEVGEMPLSIQRSFLRFLQERTFRPVGGTQEIKSDFRLISATNRDLDAMVERGEFRKDLLFRLKTVHVELPPLRTRPEDLKPLAIYHVNRLCEQYGVPHKGFSPDFFQHLAQYDWPGNVRELYNVLERSFVISGLESVLYALHLPQDIRIKITRAAIARPATGEGGIGAESAAHSGHGSNGQQPVGMQDTIPSSRRVGDPGSPDGLHGPDAAFTSPLPPLKGFKRLMERKYLEILIGQTHGNVQEMLDISGLSRSHFYALLKKNNMAL